jgi:hypothetical protein
MRKLKVIGDGLTTLPIFEEIEKVRHQPLFRNA